MIRWLALAVALWLLLGACAIQQPTSATTPTNDQTEIAEWSTEDFKDVVDFCSSLDLVTAECPRVTRELRDYGCSVEAAFELMGRAAQIQGDSERRVRLWQSAISEHCPQASLADRFPWLDPELAEQLEQDQPSGD